MNRELVIAAVAALVAADTLSGTYLGVAVLGWAAVWFGLIRLGTGRWP